MRRVLAPILSILKKAAVWLRSAPYLDTLAILIAVGVAFVFVLDQYHLEADYQPQTNFDPTQLPKGKIPPSFAEYIALNVLAYLKPYLQVITLAALGVYLLHLVRIWPNAKKMVRPTLLMVSIAAVWSICSLVHAHSEASYLSWSGELFSWSSLTLQLFLLCGTLFSPVLLLRYYTRSKVLERYVLSSFLAPLVFCFVAFCTLWIVMDLLDNLQDFQKNKIGSTQIVIFYLKLIPYIYVTVAPITLLLATVYTLGRMSRTNELISMLGTGKSLLQILRPIYLIGLYATFLCTAANYSWAPVSAGNKEALLEEAKERFNQNILAVGLFYRNQEDRRSWFVGQVPSTNSNGTLRRVEVRQEDENGKLQKAWIARSAYWWSNGGIWSFYHGTEVTYENGRVVNFRKFDFGGIGYNRHDITGWNETPWMLMSGTLTPDYLGVPDLRSFLSANSKFGSEKLAPYETHLYYRFALPWHCIVVIIFAAPLSVAFSRRGLVGGVTGAVLFFFLLMFLDNLFLNLAKGQHIHPLIAVFLPHLILGSLGIYLFILRSKNKDFPPLSPVAWWKMLKGKSKRVDTARPQLA